MTHPKQRHPPAIDWYEASLREDAYNDEDEWMPDPNFFGLTDLENAIKRDSESLRKAIDMSILSRIEEPMWGLSNSPTTEEILENDGLIEALIDLGILTRRKYSYCKRKFFAGLTLSDYIVDNYLEDCFEADRTINYMHVSLEPFYKYLRKQPTYQVYMI